MKEKVYFKRQILLEFYPAFTSSDSKITAGDQVLSWQWSSKTRCHSTTNFIKCSPNPFCKKPGPRVKQNLLEILDLEGPALL